MKLSLSSFLLAVFVFSGASVFASQQESVNAIDSGMCKLDLSQKKSAGALLTCADGQTYEIRKVAETNGGRCNGTIWCSSWEHCVDHVCVPKDVFNGCDAFHSCELGEKCVGGVCQP